LGGEEDKEPHGYVRVNEGKKKGGNKRKGKEKEHQGGENLTYL